MAGDRCESKTELVRRLHCAEGHLRGISTMIEGGANCGSVVHQIWAIQGALRELNRLIVTQHLTACLDELLANPALTPTARERCLAEVMSLYHLLNARQPVPNRQVLP